MGAAVSGPKGQMALQAGQVTKSESLWAMGRGGAYSKMKTEGIS